MTNAATAIEMTTGTAARRVASPRMISSAQRNSDIVTSARLIGLPRPMGWPNLSAPPGNQLLPFPHPRGNKVPADPNPQDQQADRHRHLLMFRFHEFSLL